MSRCIVAAALRLAVGALAFVAGARLTAASFLARRVAAEL